MLIMSSSMLQLIIRSMRWRNHCAPLHHRGCCAAICTVSRFFHHIVPRVCRKTVPIKWRDKATIVIIMTAMPVAVRSLSTFFSGVGLYCKLCMTCRRGSRRRMAPLVCNTAVHVLRLVGSYTHIMSLLPNISMQVFTCITQLFDYYFYTACLS